MSDLARNSNRQKVTDNFIVLGHVPCVFIKVRAGEYRRLDTCIDRLDTKEIGNGGNNRHLCPQVEEFLKEPKSKVMKQRRLRLRDVMFM